MKSQKKRESNIELKQAESVGEDWGRVMSKICIVFDRLRTEEKMLQKEASELGHDAVMLDAKTTQVNTDSKKEDFDFGDVVLERCVSYFRGLHFTASLEFMNVPVLNKFDVANICGNKMFMTLLLKKITFRLQKHIFHFQVKVQQKI
jgi:L-2-aminoadipate N-acetyltransferase (EC 2.3.1.-)